MPPYEQFSTVKNLGDKQHFPLKITDVHGGTVKIKSKYIFLTQYNESFDCAWDIPPRAIGRLNADISYVQTTRKISLGFKLGARNVAEAKENLKFCEFLAKTVYGAYVRREIEAGTSRSTWSYTGASLDTKIKFGNLIDNEFVFITDYDFSPDFNAGAFDSNSKETGLAGPQGGPAPTVGQRSDRHWKNGGGTPSSLISETEYVYHSNKGAIYPKTVNVTLNFIVLNSYPVGFGGPLRGEQYPLRFAANTGEDWPHRVGALANMESPDETIGMPTYMKKTTLPTNATLKGFEVARQDHIQTGQIIQHPNGRWYEVQSDGSMKEINSPQTHVDWNDLFQ